MNKNCIILHQDLRIGGAERLVLDLGLALERHDYNVKFYTCKFDPDHAFQELTDGHFQVHVHNGHIPQNLFGKFLAFFGYLRIIFLCFLVGWTTNADLYIIDQIPVGIPILKLFGKKVLYYCHFPDKYCCNKRESFIKRLYRAPIDFIEEKTTDYADKIVVNSKFTQSMFAKAFPTIYRTPEVIYPTYNKEFDNLDKTKDYKDVSLPFELEDKVFVSINRFEEKKNHELAIKAYALLNEKEKENTMLIIAGGFINDNDDCLRTEKKLIDVIKENNLENKVFFLKNFTSEQLEKIFKKTIAVVYTPSFEHFGIVPLEAMIHEIPVIAVNNGGPMETVIDGVSGYLCESNPEAFKEAYVKLLDDETQNKMKINAKTETSQKFGFDKFTKTVIEVVDSMNN